MFSGKDFALKELFRPSKVDVVGAKGLKRIKMDRVSKN
jgi:hypothetical protein